MILLLLSSCTQQPKSNSLLIEKPFDQRMAYGSLEIKNANDHLTLSVHLNNLKSTYSYEIDVIDNESCTDLQTKDLHVLFALKDSSSSISGGLFAFADLPHEGFPRLDVLYGKRLIVLNKLASTQMENLNTSIEICFEIKP